VSDIDTVVVDSLKVLDPDGRLEKRPSPCVTSNCRGVPQADIRIAAKIAFNGQKEAKPTSQGATVASPQLSAERGSRSTREVALFAAHFQSSPSSVSSATSLPINFYATAICRVVGPSPSSVVRRMSRTSLVSL